MIRFLFCILIGLPAMFVLCLMGWIMNYPFWEDQGKMVWEGK